MIDFFSGGFSDTLLHSALLEGYRENTEKVEISYSIL